MWINKLLILALALVWSCATAFEANAQTKKRKLKPRRPTNAVARPKSALPPMIEPEVVSRASDELTADSASVANAQNGVNPNVVRSLPTAQTNPVGGSAPIDKKNLEREREDRSLLDLERLSLAEARAEAFRKQLSDVIDREAGLRSKIDQLDYQMRPENIQLETATVGSLRPEELRESRRKMIENEKLRTADQLGKTVESRTRLELAIANADALVDKLRARVEAEAAQETGKSSDKISARDSVEPISPDN